MALVLSPSATTQRHAGDTPATTHPFTPPKGPREANFEAPVAILKSEYDFKRTWLTSGLISINILYVYGPFPTFVHDIFTLRCSGEPPRSKKRRLAKNLRNPIIHTISAYPHLRARFKKTLEIRFKMH